MKNVLDIKVKITDREVVAEVDPGLVAKFLRARGWAITNPDVHFGMNCDVWALRREFWENRDDALVQVLVPRKKGACQDYADACFNIIRYMEERYGIPQLRLLAAFTGQLSTHPTLPAANLPRSC